MNQLKVFENDLFKVSAKQEGDQILFDAEQVARCLGFVSKTYKNGTAYENVRWSRVNGFLPQVAEIKSGDLIPEPLVYKLAFKASNDLAEKFQDWLAIDVIPSIRKTGFYGIDTTQLSPELQMMNQMFQAVAKNELETKEAKKLAIQASKKAENISNLVTLTSDDWRDKVNSILKKIARNWTGVEPYRSVKNLSYERLEKRARCNLNIRLNNRKERALAQGMSKAYVQRINKLDCIAEEKRLVEIYLQVVKEMAIQFNIDINDFEEVI